MADLGRRCDGTSMGDFSGERSLSAGGMFEHAELVSFKGGHWRGRESSMGNKTTSIEGALDEMYRHIQVAKDISEVGYSGNTSLDTLLFERCEYYVQLTRSCPSDDDTALPHGRTAKVFHPLCPGRLTWSLQGCCALRALWLCTSSSRLGCLCARDRVDYLDDGCGDDS